MKTVAVVPMKLNNSRLPGKNTKPFTNGLPLCTYVLKTLSSIREIDEVHVFCSNDLIKEYLPDGVIYTQRSTSLDTDSTKINDVLSAFSNKVEADVYLLAHATGPFITAESIKRGIKAVVEEGYDSALAVRKIQNFIWTDGKPMNYDPKSIPRTQDLKPLFEETCGFYCFKKEILTKMGTRIGNKPYLVEVSAIEGIDIDNPEDFDMADAWYNYVLMNKQQNRLR